MSTDPNRAAFPTSNNFRSVVGGLTKREYFAGQALMGLLANPLNRHSATSEIIEAAYKHADAMCGVALVADTLASLRDRMQARHDVIVPLIIMGDDDSTELSPHQRGMQYAFAEVVKAIDGYLLGETPDVAR